MLYNWLTFPLYRLPESDLPVLTSKPNRDQQAIVSVEITELSAEDTAFMDRIGSPGLWHQLAKVVMESAFDNPDPAASLPRFSSKNTRFCKRNPRAVKILLKYAAASKRLRKEVEAKIPKPI